MVFAPGSFWPASTPPATTRCAQAPSKTGESLTPRPDLLRHDVLLMSLGDSSRNAVLPLGNLVLSVELREQRHLRSIRLALLAQDKFLDFRLPIANSIAR